MKIFKRIIAGIIIAISLVGAVLFLAGIAGVWSLNTPLTHSLTRTLSGVEQFLTMSDNALGRINDDLAGAQTAVIHIEETVETAGDILEETNIAYQVLDRTIGDDLFPKVISAKNTAVSLRDGVVAFNATLEAANEIPFVDIPTLSGELETISDKLTTVRTSVQEMKEEVNAVKDEAISKPVTAVTNRTSVISSGLGEAQTAVSHTQTEIEKTETAVAAVKAKVPGTIDMISVIVTLIFLWLAFSQAGLTVLAWRYFKEA